MKALSYIHFEGLSTLVDRKKVAVLFAKYAFVFSINESKNMSKITIQYECYNILYLLVLRRAINFGA